MTIAGTFSPLRTNVMFTLSKIFSKVDYRVCSEVKAEVKAKGKYKKKTTPRTNLTKMNLQFVRLRF